MKHASTSDELTHACSIRCRRAQARLTSNNDVRGHSAFEHAVHQQACIDEMQEIAHSVRQKQEHAGDRLSAAAAADKAAVFQEMLDDCRRKAGDATLDRLRRLCHKHGSAATEQADDSTEEGETVLVSYHASLLGRAEGAANIYGGCVRVECIRCEDKFGH